MTAFRTGCVLGALLLEVGLAACGGGGGGNSSPVLGAPMGPGPLGGIDPAFTAQVILGDSIDLSVTATDGNTNDTLTLTATVTAGNLTAGQAGFSTLFPATMMSISPATLNLTGTAAVAGQVVLTFDLDDGRGGTDTMTLTIDIDTLPQIGAPTGPGTVGGGTPAYSTTIDTGDSLDFSITATDADPSDTIIFNADVTSGTLTATQAGFTTPFPLTNTGPSPQPLGFSGTAAMAGDITLTFDVDDGRGGIDIITLSITINPNAPPQIGRPGGPGTVGGTDPAFSSTVNIGDALAFSVFATDVNAGNTLTFTVTATGGALTAAQAGFDPLPPSATGSSPQTLNFSGTAAMAGDITLAFNVDDGQGGTDTITHAITINTPPQISTPSGPGILAGADPSYTTTINIGDAIGFSVTATDADVTDTLTFMATVTGGTLTSAQAGFVEMFPSSGVGASPQSLTFTGTAATAGDIVLTFAVDDARGGADMITHAITINAPPQIGMPTGPGAVGGVDPAYTTTVNIGASLGFNVTALDPNSLDTLTLSVTETGGTLTAAQAGFGALPSPAVGMSPQSLAFTGTAAMAGDVVLQFDVDDGLGGTDVVTLTVNINTPPQIAMPTGPGTVGGVDPAYTTTVFIVDSLAFTVDGTDADGDTVMLTATVTGGTLTATQAGFNETFPLMATGPATQTLTFTGAASTAGDIEITFDIDDGRGGTDLITHTVTIMADTTPPDPIGDLSAAYSGVIDTIQLDWTATGDDGATGTATAYILRFSASPILNDTDFNAAMTYPQTWTPLAAGNMETLVVDLTLVGYSWYGGLGYFAIKAEDEVPNESSLLSPLTVSTDLQTTFPATFYSFGSVGFSDVASANFDYTNDSAVVDLVISTIALLGDPEFTIAAGGGAPVTLPPASTHTVTVEYMPLAVGADAATLDVTHNDVAKTSPYVISLSGIGANGAPQITAMYTTPTPVPVGIMPSFVVEVTDSNNDLPATNDIASVIIDLTSIGGLPNVPMGFTFDLGPKVARYELFLTVGAVTTGVYDIPVTVTDLGGAVATDVFGLAFFTGAQIDVIPPGTIQAAIDIAVNGDAVVVSAGTWVGPGNTNLRTNGKQIIVMGRPTDTVIIDCENVGRAFLFNNSGETGSTVIFGFDLVNAAVSAIFCFSDPGTPMDASPIIRNCIFDTNTNSSHGGAMVLDGALANPLIKFCVFSNNMVDLGNFRAGAIFVTNGSGPTIEGTSFTNNQGLEGGAIATLGGSITATNCTFSGNGLGSGDGGAIWLDGPSSSITGCTFDMNVTTVTFGARGDGGALFTRSDLTVIDCLFTNNSAVRAGGAFATGTGGLTIAFTGCLFSGNRSPVGGATFEASTQVSSTFTRCTFDGNESTGARGGAVNVQGGAGGITFSDCLFTGNLTAGDGGGIYFQGGSVGTPNRILNCPFTGHIAANGGGVHLFAGGGTAYTTMTDTIVWGNLDTANADEVFVENSANLFATFTFCDIDTGMWQLDDAGLRVNAPIGFVPGTSGNLSADPLFVIGLRGDTYLSQIAAGQLFDSPCFDAGSMTAGALGLDTRTTRTDGVPDATGSLVDLGSHFEP
ncbi:MAG: right-handed parallel beta-helix repeat-containing protein [Planctomycetota bacterium]|nr:right-handed parallel beta-helix repeat-containing protein [Planctomycetota bacterium]